MSLNVVLQAGAHLPSLDSGSDHISNWHNPLPIDRHSIYISALHTQLLFADDTKIGSSPLRGQGGG